MFCRICDDDLRFVLSLSSMPLANDFQTEKINETSYPLDVYECKSCGLVQLGKVPPKELMFSKYPYFSSTSEPLKEHFKFGAAEIYEFYGKEKPFVVDIGSNDGALLHYFKKLECKILGIEPAKNIAVVANEKGIQTVNSFWNKYIAKTIVNEHGKADIIVATNVLCHQDNLHEFMEAVDILLKEDGLFVHEDPHLPDIIQGNAFDQIYHEHTCFFNSRALSNLFDLYKMEIVEMKNIPIHGGSIRVYVKRFPDLKQFATVAEKKKESLVKLLKELKKEGKKIIGYGASSKGNVWLNYCGIGTDLLDYIVDNTPEKIGKYTPGMHIPVKSPEHLKDADYALLLIWNWKDHVLEKEKEWREKGGKFILPIPELEVV